MYMCTMLESLLPFTKPRQSLLLMLDALTRAPSLKGRVPPCWPPQTLFVLYFLRSSSNWPFTSPSVLLMTGSAMLHAVRNAARCALASTDLHQSNRHGHDMQSVIAEIAPSADLRSIFRVLAMILALRA